MNPTAKENHLVEDVVRSLTTTEGLVGGESDVLREQMQRAAADFDGHTAQAFAEALLGTLCDAPQDVRKLEALMILGLAHPDILLDNRIPLETEARRLAVLLERSGEAERARCILEVVASRAPEGEGLKQDLSEMTRRTTSSAQLVDRYLARSDEEVQAGRVEEAIRWLQQVLVLDPERRDVARMIRDLRFQDSERRARNRRRLRLFFFVITVTGLMAGLLLRELHLEELYQSVPEAAEHDEPSMAARIRELDALVEANRFWLGGFRAVNERRGLESALRTLRARRVESESALVSEQRLRLDAAENARLLGLQAARDGRLEEALEKLRDALGLAPEDWEHRERVGQDVAALEEWRSEGR